MAGYLNGAGYGGPPGSIPSPSPLAPSQPMLHTGPPLYKPLPDPLDDPPPPGPLYSPPPPAPVYSPPPSGPYGPPMAPHASPPPGMPYGAPPAAPMWVYLGSIRRLGTACAVYGPPGACFDRCGNVYITHPNGMREGFGANGVPGGVFDERGNVYISNPDSTREWIGEYVNGAGRPTRNPNEVAEQDSCFFCYGYPTYK